jgi:hypothetical protein
MKPEPTTPSTTEQSPPIQADQKLTVSQVLRLSAVLAERELGEALERWDDEGGACA